MMTCPGCGAPMPRVHVEGKLDRLLDVDYCAACRVIWFDRLEDLQLSAPATLTLFEIVVKPQTPPVPVDLSHPLPCPVCRARLVLTHDMQRATKFRYWRCPAEHGRLISFVDFLRAKDFVRPLTPAEINRLRQTVVSVHCDNCGAPIDLVRDTLCGHCGSPISVLDPTQTARTIAQLQQQSASKPFEIDPDDGRTADDGFDVLLRSMKTDAGSESSRGMVNVGLRFVADLLKKR
jgi:TFIIB-like protein